MKNKLVLLIGIFLISTVTHAANYYIRDGATGTSCSDWTTANACDKLPSVLERGSTYYIADGNYDSYSFGNPQGTTIITVKKATIADHGITTGWNDDYGDGTAFWTEWSFNGKYYLIDGATRGSDWRSGYGFKVKAIGDRPVNLYNGNNYVSGNITLRNFEVEGLGVDNDVYERLVYGIFTNNVTLQNCYLHDTGSVPVVTGSSSDWLMEYCVLARNSSNAYRHAEGWAGSSDNRITIRYNIFEDIEGTGQIVVLGRGGTAIEYNDQWEIYGNTFFYTPGNPYNREGSSDSAIAVINNQVATNMKIYNNSFINMYLGLADKIAIGGDGATGHSAVIQNNFWWGGKTGVTANLKGGTFTVSHNRFDGVNASAVFGANNQVNAQANTSVFKDYNAKDFRLAAATSPGNSLPQAYNKDRYSLERGKDGNWDIGAFEYAPSCTGVCYYVTLTGTGAKNGNDWNNAFAGLPATLVRGATYYIAGNATSYGSYTFDDAPTNAQYITIKKAIEADHGTDTGWVSGYGTTQALFNSLSFTTDYWVLDGSTRNEDNWFDGASYGFRIYGGENVENQIAVPGSSNVKIKYTYLQASNAPLSTTTTGRRYGLDLYPWNLAVTQKGIEVSRSFFQYGNVPIFAGRSNNYIEGLLLEYSAFDANQSNDANHGEAMSCYYKQCGKDFVIRFNKFRATHGTAVIAVGGDSGAIDNFQFYGNIMWNMDIGDGIVGFSEATRSNFTNAKIYNNTIVNKAGGFNTGVAFMTGSNNQVYNNLWYNTPGVWNGSNGSVILANNIINPTNDPFVNAAAENFTLKASIGTGSPLGAPYNVDITGVTRGADGNFDIGAYEFKGTVSGNIPPTVSVTSSPTTATAPATITLNATASDSDGTVASVAFYNGSTLLSTDTSSPYSYTWSSVAAGSYSVRAVATDDKGATSTATITVVVDGPALPAGSLVAYWALNETSGTTASDSSGNGKTASLSGSPVWAAGIAGNGLTLNGTNAYVNAGSFNLTQFTLSVWMNMTAVQSGWMSIIMKQHVLGMEIQNGVLSANVGNGSSWSSSISAPLSAGAWHHVVQTYDGSNNRLYVDGNLIASGTGALTNNSNNLLIGSWNGSMEFFNGKVDEIKIYNGALTATQVKSMYDAIVSPVILGDVNVDGNVNITDVLLTSQYAVGSATPTATQRTAADMNSDGVVNISDVLLVARKAVGL